MPILPGDPHAADFNDPIGLMTACHRRVERFLGVLSHVADRLPSPLDAQERDAMTMAVRYFSEAAPKHTDDEELTLAPRLFAMDHPDVVNARSHWADLENDHRAKVPHLATVTRVGATLAETGAVEPLDAVAFQRAVSHLTEIYTPHIAYEDSVLFPLARALLTPEQQRKMGLEMAARRGVDWAG